jgi:PIN domain nuclease of toxin-antitoxin system
MAGIVLDASALLALLRGEPSGRKVADALHGARMSVVNHAEIVSFYAQQGSDRHAIDDMLKTLPIDLVPVDPGLAMLAGMLRPITREAGLSLGDRFCLALAKREGLPAWTADKTWKTIAAAAEVKVVVIR